MLDSGKLVPADMQLDLIVRAMGSSTPPFLLPDYPRMAAGLKALEGKVGGVGLALSLPTGAEDRVSALLLKHLSSVSEVTAGEGAVGAALEAMREAGVA